MNFHYLASITQSVAMIMAAIALILIIKEIDKIKKDIEAMRGTPYKTPPKPILKPKKQEETEEERKYNAIIDNIDNYDGTGKNQKEVR